MRKWLLVIIGIMVLGCGPAPSTNGSDEGQLVKKIYLNYHHTENCPGHDIQIGKVLFKDEGHDMIMYFVSNNGNESSNPHISIIHHPKCELCNPESSESVLEEEPKSSYWGW